MRLTKWLTIANIQPYSSSSHSRKSQEHTADPSYYKLVQEYFSDISEAKEMGFSWGQIKRAFLDELYGRQMLIPGWEDLPLDEYFSLAAKNRRERF